MVNLNNWEKFIVELNNLANQYDINIFDTILKADTVDGEKEQDLEDYIAINELTERSRDLQEKEWSILA